MSGNPALGGFVSLGEVLAQDAKAFFQKAQGISVPATKPVSSPGFSFNFGDAFNSLTKPVRDFFDPVQQAKNQTVLSTAGAASNVIKATGDLASGLITSAGQRLADALNNQNKKTVVNTSLVPTVLNPMPSQSESNLAQLLSFLSGVTSANPTVRTSAPDQLVQSAADASKLNIYLIGGVIILGAFILTSKGGAK